MCNLSWDVRAALEASSSTPYLTGTCTAQSCHLCTGRTSVSTVVAVARTRKRFGVIPSPKKREQHLELLYSPLFFLSKLCPRTGRCDVEVVPRGSRDYSRSVGCPVMVKETLIQVEIVAVRFILPYPSSSLSLRTCLPLELRRGPCLRLPSCTLAVWRHSRCALPLTPTLTEREKKQKKGKNQFGINL